VIMFVAAPRLVREIFHVKIANVAYATPKATETPE